MSDRPACMKCKFYYVTWEAPLAHGCRAHGFKSAAPPSQVVHQSSGMDCQAFVAKPNPPRQTEITDSE
ncbi:MAG TPA: uracil-DNA glycosylase [Bdellovibrionota bacterium]|nr:uracil-DNA glycosylase [Bdellovibrionota bacterium]